MNPRVDRRTWPKTVMKVGQSGRFKEPDYDKEAVTLLKEKEKRKKIRNLADLVNSRH